jgi:catechol 2,3-dioxygenase-like lactoylglutathione lyase family enzyme
MGPGLRVSDLEAAARFYRDGLGLSIVGRVPLGELEELILGFGPDRRPPFLFLVGPKDAKSQERDEGPKSPGRIVFAVSNAQAAHARLLSAGYAPDPIKVHEASGTILFWATDPDGYRLEITQPGQSGAQGGEHG